jgi:2'-5' RNA ligase
MIRLFAALAIPGDVAAELARHQTGLRDVRWRPAESLHLTLRFFGDVDERRAEDIASALEAATGPAFDVALSGVGAFGEGHRLNAVWAGVEENPELRRLAARCEGAARRAGCAPETRNYTPHITLAYLKHTDPAHVAAWIAAHNLLRVPPFHAARFMLFSSWPGENGQTYEVERFYPLR